VASHLLGVFQSSIVFQVNGDACGPPGVTSNWGEKAKKLLALRILGWPGDLLFRPQAGWWLAQIPRFLDSILILCGLAGAFSDYFGSIA
jgi:hypothetical protein